MYKKDKQDTYNFMDVELIEPEEIPEIEIQKIELLEDYKETEKYKNYMKKYNSLTAEEKKKQLNKETKEFYKNSINSITKTITVNKEIIKQLEEMINKCENKSNKKELSKTLNKLKRTNENSKRHLNNLIRLYEKELEKK